MVKTIANLKSADRAAVRTNFALPVLAVIILIEVIAAKPLHDWMMAGAVSEQSKKWQKHFSETISTGERTGEFQHAAFTIQTALDTHTIRRIALYDPQCHCRLVVAEATELPTKDIETELEKLVTGQLAQGAQVGFGVGASEPMVHRGDHTAHNDRPQKINDGDAQLFNDSSTIDLRDGRSIELMMHFDVGSAARSHFVMIEVVGVIMTVLSGMALLTAERFAKRSNRAHTLSMEKAQYLAKHDPLTGLLNRYGFQSGADDMIDAGSGSAERLCLVQIDVDKFKDINDLHGHPTGDKAIQCIADHIKRNFPENSIAARLGGDEFGVLVDESALGGDAAVFLEYMPMKTHFMVRNGNQEIQVGMTAGYAIFPDDGLELSDLMKCADLALLSAKNTSKGIATRYQRSMTEALESRIGEIEGIRHALSEDRIIPFYQPIIDTASGKVAGFEALARWNHPKRGILTPAAFENALVDPSTSLAITERMLEKVADDQAQWHSLGYSVRTTLNLGEADLKQPTLPERLSDALVSRGLPHSALVVEVTESAVFASNLADVLPVLRSIRKHGIDIALDDFGTGASSLMLLQTLPCSAVKIDKSFVGNCLTDDASMAIVRALINLGKDLGLKTVAEGVETLKQVELLERLEVDLLQGFCFSRPMPREGIEDFLRLVPVVGAPTGPVEVQQFDAGKSA